jgi:hypothetical protein
MNLGMKYAGYTVQCAFGQRSETPAELLPLAEYPVEPSSEQTGRPRGCKRTLSVDLAQDRERHSANATEVVN